MTMQDQVFGHEVAGQPAVCLQPIPQARQSRRDRPARSSGPEVTTASVDELPHHPFRRTIVMSLSSHVIGVDAVPSTKTAAAISGSIRLLAQRVTSWVSAFRDYRATAAFYEHLSGLSDVELRNRELSRDTLARDLSWRWRELM
jgi:hypothetical protein